MQFNKLSTFTNDDFFLYNSPTQTNLTVMDYVSIMQEPILDFIQCNNPWLPFAEFSIVSSKNVHSLTRTYQKIQEALANVSGLVNILMLIGMIFSALHAKLSLFFIIGKKLYNYNLGKKTIQNDKNITSGALIMEMTTNEKEITEKKEFHGLGSPLSGIKPTGKPNINAKETADSPQIEKSKIIKENQEGTFIQSPEVKDTPCNDYPIENEKKIPESGFKINSSRIERKILKDSEPLLAKEEDVIIYEDQFNRFKIHCHNKSKRKNEKINTLNYLSASFKKIFNRKLTHREKIILNTKEALEEDIDIVNILHRIQELEKLKSLLLTQDQLVLFNHLDKPTILEEEYNRQHTTLVSMKKLKTKDGLRGTVN